MEASIGVNLRVTAHSSQGGRKYMEDMFCVAYQPTADEKDLLYAYFGIFDGHGGREAAAYAKQHLMDHIVSQKNFWSDDDQLVLKAIRDGFISTHYAMWKDLGNWPKTPSGLPSTSGTTASIGFVRKGKMFIGHVGDSAIVLGYQDPVCGYWRARSLTTDHKPESLEENARITQCGGKVINKSGVPRVVWNRPRVGHKGPVRRSTMIDEIPFLAVARSLGDLWSYNSAQNEFVVSPEPDVSVIEIDVNCHRCLILGSDGLWNMLNAQDSVNTVYFAEKNNERQLLASPPHTASTQVKNWINPSKRLVDRALDRWIHHNLRADNTSVVTVVIDPPGPPKAQVLRQNQRSYVMRHSTSSVTDPSTSKTVPAMVLSSTPCAAKSFTPSKPIHAIPDSNILPVATAPRASTSTSEAGPSKYISRHAATANSKSASAASSNLSKPVAAHFIRSRNATRALAKPKTVSVARVDDVPTSSSISSAPILRTDVGNLKNVPSHEAKKRTISEANVGDDVQIHEISSSSESEKSGSTETEPRSNPKKRKLISRTEKGAMTRQVKTEVYQRPATRGSASKAVEPDAKLGRTRGQPITSGGLTGQREVVDSPSNILRSSSRPKRSTENKPSSASPKDKPSSAKKTRQMKVSVSTIAEVKSRRSLRSTSRTAVRCTRSMTKPQ